VEETVLAPGREHGDAGILDQLAHFLFGAVACLLVHVGSR
jgi:hypothetical protein